MTPTQRTSDQIIAIDAGLTHSAWVVYVPGSGRIIEYGIAQNDEVIEMLGGVSSRHGFSVVLEMIKGYGLPVGQDIFETCVWIGRFMQAFNGKTERISRREVKLYLCGNSRAKDANVRAALIERFGPSKRQAIGTKKEPGPLYGIKRDMWAALGVAVAFAGMRRERRRRYIRG